MAIIDYKILGSYPPFAVELRSGSETGPIVDTMVATSANTDSSFYSFTGVTSGATYFVVAYDNAFGVDSGEKIL
jgi:hypothetical protein